MKDLRSLQRIVGSAYFKNSQIADLGQLQSIERNAFFGHSPIINLKNLRKIGGKIYWEEEENLKRQWEEIQDRFKMEVTGQDMWKAGFEGSETEKEETRKVIDEERGRKHIEKWY